MDPQELLNRLREWANGDDNDNGVSASDAMEAFQELDKWLSDGGFCLNHGNGPQMIGKWYKRSEYERSLFTHLLAL